jgi:hypothetical protein
MPVNLATSKPHKMLSFVARRILDLSQDEWTALGEDEQKRNIAAAKRAVAATDGFREKNPDGA